jgi:peptidyl-prolyl cis-trans isomerase C
MRNVKARIALLALGSLVLLNACNAQDDKKSTDTVLATVNGTAIHQSAMDILMRQGAAQGAPDTPEVRKAMLDELVGRELARQDAVKMGLDKRPDVKQQAELANQAVLINAFMRQAISRPPHFGEDRERSERHYRPTQKRCEVREAG